MKLYWTCRYERIGTVDLWNKNSLNWVYTPSFYLNNQFADWNTTWLTNVIDQEIPEDRYVLEIAPWVPKLTRFISCEYNETYVDPIELKRSLENVWARFNVDIFETIDEAIARIKENTNLTEIEPWKFLIESEKEGMIPGEIIPAKYLTIQ